jgi:hypothetical protein
LFCGYSSWVPGQLASEIEYGTWIVAKPTQEFIFARTEDEHAGVDIRDAASESEPQQMVHTDGPASVGAQKHTPSYVGALELNIEQDDDHDGLVDQEDDDDAVTNDIRDTINAAFAEAALRAGGNIMSEQQQQQQQQKKQQQQELQLPRTKSVATAEAEAAEAAENAETTGTEAEAEEDEDTRELINRIQDMYSPHTMWSDILTELGGEYAHFARTPKDLPDALERLEAQQLKE